MLIVPRIVQTTKLYKMCIRDRFIGLVPLLMGLKLLIKGEQEDDEGDKTFASANKYKTLLVQIIACLLYTSCMN